MTRTNKHLLTTAAKRIALAAATTWHAATLTPLAPA